MIKRLSVVLITFSADSILSYRIPEEKEDYTIVEDPQGMDIDIDPQLLGSETGMSSTNPLIKSNLRLPPPPLFSRQAVPHIYKLPPLPLFKLNYRLHVIQL